MVGRTNKRVLAPLRTLALAGAILATAFVGSAIAGGNSVRVRVPRHVSTGVSYSLAMRGFAAHRERLYLFVDYYACAATPSIEHYAHHANGDYWTVRGHFVRTSHDWHSLLSREDHACVYLTRLSAPINSSGGVLADSFRAYRIH